MSLLWRRVYPDGLNPVSCAIVAPRQAVPVKRSLTGVPNSLRDRLLIGLCERYPVTGSSYRALVW